MSPPNPSPLLLLILLSISISISIPSISSSPLSTVAISHISNNKTLVCALLPSTNSQYDLNCTSLPNRTTHYYPSGTSSYAAIAASDGLLCALASPPLSNTSTMRWWDFTHNTRNNSIPDQKRVYKGPTIVALSAGDSHVCGLTGNSRTLNCWRWPQLSIPAGLNINEIAVGGDFVCVLLDSGAIKCFGGDRGIIGNEPNGTYMAVAAGSSHACGVSLGGELICWGVGAPKVTKNLLKIDSLALGENRTCALCVNGTVLCWGENLELPKDLVHAQFIGIQAKGNAFCGILMANYSLICWGSEVFHQNHVVFNQVLPGTCAPISSCPCGIVAGSGNFCANGAICRPCEHALKVDPNSTVTYYRRSGISKRRLLFIILGSVAFIGLAAASYFLFLKFRYKSGRVHDSGRLNVREPAPAILPVVRPRPDPGIERHLSALFSKGHSSTIEEFPIKLLIAVTNGFSEEHKIGSGSFGSVYRATLDDGRVVAIKRAEASASASTSRARAPAAGDNRRHQDKESAFLAELALLSRVNHKNLVRLLGYCKDGSERVLVYEFMTNGTLHDLLHRPVQELGSPIDSWPARIRVALDAARGIEYLHTYAVPPIIHRDIKSSNILLDDSWTAKVSDFGLSLMSPDGFDDGWSNVSFRAAGTVGYMDPEYYRLQHLTAKSDVYSFGVVLLELLSGCKVIQRYGESCTPKNVVEFAVPHIAADDIHWVLDPRLAPPTPSEIEAVVYLGYLAADCVSLEGRERPTMTEIVNGLESALAACTAPSLSRSTTTTWSG